jgi:glutamyl-tRNA reductase
MLKIEIDMKEVEAAVKTHFQTKYPGFISAGTMMGIQSIVKNNALAGANIIIADSAEELAEALNPDQDKPTVKRTRRTRAEIEAEEAAKKAAATPDKVPAQQQQAIAKATAPAIEEEPVESIISDLFDSEDAE